MSDQAVKAYFEHAYAVGRVDVCRGWFIKEGVPA